MDREPPSDDRLREIAELADLLAAERKRIAAPDPDGNPPWGGLCAWASRGEAYMEAIRSYPPEGIYRELIAEIARLRAESGERMRRYDQMKALARSHQARAASLEEELESLRQGY
jgi:hypothetical protein